MAKISRRDFLKVSSLAAAGVVLAACGQQATVAPTPAPVATAAPKATEAPKGPTRPDKFPAGDVARNRTLIYYNNTPMAGACNPFAGAYNHQNGNAVLYEPAAFYGAHADKTYLWLAESAKPNDKATEWTITFRKGIKWSDGTPFTAKDVEWSMNKLGTAKGLNRQGTYTLELDKATAIDDTTLKVALKMTDWRFFFKSLTFRFDLGDDTAIQPMHIYKDLADADIPTLKVFDVAKGWPVSTGPYGVSESNEQNTKYDLRPTWWAADTGLVPAYPDVWRIVQQPFTNNNNAAQLLINKEVDQTLDLRPMMVASILAQAPHLDTWTGKKMPYGYMDWWPISVQFCTQVAPVDNADVRWAIAYALDQQKIVDIAWGGAGIVANSPFPGFAKLNDYMAGIKDLTDKYNVLEVSLDKSAALMAKAGYSKDKDGYYVDKDGARPDFNIYGDANLFGDLSPVVAEQLRAAGFWCEHKSPPDVWAASVDGRARLFLFGHGGATMDPFDTFMLYQSSQVLPLGQQSWGNITRWGPPEFEKLRDEMNNTAMDDPKMKDLFHSMMDIYYTQLPDCPIVQWFHRIPVNTWYWSNWGTDKNPYMNSALWHLTELMVVINLKATNAA